MAPKSQETLSSSQKASAKKDLSSSKKRKRNTEEAAASASTEPATAPKKVVGARVFKVEDEIALLKGMIASNISNGTKASLVKLHESLDAKLNGFSDGQLYEKIRRLREKFQRYRQLSDPASLEGYNATVFQLSSTIWGDSNDLVHSASKDRIGSKKKGKQKVEAAAGGDSAELPESDEWKNGMLKSIAALMIKYQGKAALLRRAE